MTDTADIQALKAQNAELLDMLEHANNRLAAVTDVLASIGQPAPIKTLTEQAARLKAEQTKEQAPEGSLTRAAQDLAATHDTRLVEVLRRRAQGLHDEEPVKAAHTGLTAQAEAMRTRAH